MPTLNLTPDELLSTTRAVRKRLDFSRPVEPEVIRECLELAMQAPNGGNRQPWHFVVVTDAEKRRALGDIYRKGWATYLGMPFNQPEAHAALAAKYPERAQTQLRVASSAQYLADHMHEAPVLLIPCVWGRADGQPAEAQAGLWGSILPAAWSFMLAARARGLGTSLTTVHLFYEQEAADLLGIPYARVTQAGLIPVAYTEGTEFKPAAREPLDRVTHWNGW
ncbi:MAG TPA: nitroreductase family protein [Ktedonobacterales bacterium]|nr:nitroreductase family protein [Ktedonobacterales bacterium]